MEFKDKPIRLEEPTVDRLKDMSLSYDNVQDFIANVGWEDWMQNYTLAGPDEPMSEEENEKISEYLTDLYNETRSEDPSVTEERNIRLVREETRKEQEYMSAEPPVWEDQEGYELSEEEILISNLNDTFREIYDKLGSDKMDGNLSYKEALDIGDALINARNPIVEYLIDTRGDFFTSDREVATLGYVYKENEANIKKFIEPKPEGHELSEDRQAFMNDAIKKISDMKTEDFVLEFVDKSDKEALKEALDNGFLPIIMEGHEMELSLKDGRLEYEGTSMGGNSEFYFAVEKIKEAVEDISRSSPFIDSINATIDNTYRDLYEGKQIESSVSYSEALDIGDALIQAKNPIIKSLIEARGDYFSSDREVAALGYAYKEHESEIKKLNELEPDIEQGHTSSSVDPDMDI